MPTPQLMVFTKFYVPETASLEDEYWGYFARGLKDCPGHYVSKWGRIEEHLNYVLLITLWTFQEELNQFRALSSHETYLSALHRYSSIPPEVYEFDYNFPTPWLRNPSYRISFICAHFSASIGLEKSHEEPRVKALESKVAVMPNARRYVTFVYTGIPIGLWDKRKADDGEKPKTCVIFYLWTNAETEQDFKHKEGRYGQTKYQLAEQELRDDGAESWTEEHWVPRKLPNSSK